MYVRSYTHDHLVTLRHVSERSTTTPTFIYIISIPLPSLPQ